MAFAFFSWLAVMLLTIGFWIQVWKIHVHREVRDLSIAYYILLACGFGILSVAAYVEHSTIFLTKQILTTIPTVIIILQILYHRNDTWHDPDLKKCKTCSAELERHWSFCAYCGGKKKS